MPKQLTAKEMAKKSVASRRAKYKTEEEYCQAMKDMAAKRKVKGNFKPRYLACIWCGKDIPKDKPYAQYCSMQCRKQSS